MYRGFTIEKVLQMPLTQRLEPRPFPGKYPTRIAWVLKQQGGRTYSYIGKPSANALKQLLMMQARRPAKQIDFVEFDMGHVVGRAEKGRLWGYDPLKQGDVGFKSRVNLQLNSPALLQFYHPTTAAVGSAFSDGEEPVRVVKWRCLGPLGPVVRVYGELKVRRAEREQWRAWVQEQLRQQGVAL